MFIDIFFPCDSGIVRRIFLFGIFRRIFLHSFTCFVSRNRRLWRHITQVDSERVWPLALLWLFLVPWLHCWDITFLCNSFFRRIIITFYHTFAMPMLQFTPGQHNIWLRTTADLFGKSVSNRLDHFRRRCLRIICSCGFSGCDASNYPSHHRTIVAFAIQ